MLKDFDDYIIQGEPSQAEKSRIWKTAIGLQKVDELTPSAYLIETAKENIEGKITIGEVKARIDSYYKLSNQEMVEHIAKFISGLWQIHAFGEGNTRAVAVFAIKYLRTFGFKVENDMFAEHSWYFRNALVRANFNDYLNKIFATQKYLNYFFGNLLLGENNELKNRYFHIDFVPLETDGGNGNTPNKLGVFCAKKLGVKSNKNQQKILALLEANNKMTLIEMAQNLAISQTAVENNIRKLRKHGIIDRIGSDKTGSWKILQQPLP